MNKLHQLVVAGTLEALLGVLDAVSFVSLYLTHFLVAYYCAASSALITVKVFAFH